VCGGKHDEGLRAAIAIRRVLAVLNDR